MTPMEGLERALAAAQECQSLADHEVEWLLEHFVALLRRDWAVRVLDAWAEPSERAWTMNGEGWWWCDCVDHADKRAPVRRGNGPTPTTARHSTAVAVFPRLTDKKKDELGECP